jgi:hypothetical protein
MKQFECGISYNLNAVGWKADKGVKVNHSESDGSGKILILICFCPKSKKTETETKTNVSEKTIVKVSGFEIEKKLR